MKEMCEHDLCIHEALVGTTICYAHTVSVRCELSTCDAWAYVPWTTCKRHSALLLGVGEQPNRLMRDAGKTRIPMDNNDFRFSASYASRYNNCHGSAHLELAIPGFEHPTRNNDGMKGEGTRLHKIFEIALSDRTRIEDCMALLTEIASLWGPHRTTYLEQDEKKYVIGWFLKHKTPPPLELADLKEALLQYKPVKDEHGNDTEVMVAAGVPPRRIMHVVQSLGYVKDLIEEMDQDTLEVFIEAKVPATWLTTSPKTTVDLIIRDKDKMHVLDLKMGDIEVSPIANEQLMYYAETFRQKSAELDLPDKDNWYEDITLHIMQRGFMDEWSLPKTVLTEWVNTVKESEQAILDGDLTMRAGDHCKFCPANPHARGDKGNKACPVMMTVLYGERDQAQSDIDVLEGDDDE